MLDSWITIKPGEVGLKVRAVSEGLLITCYRKNDVGVWDQGNSKILTKEELLKFLGEENGR